MNRREFIRAGALSAAAFAAPRVFAADAPGLNGLPTVAVIGFGPQGRGLLRQFLGLKVVVKAVCDCDRTRCEDALRRVREYYEQNSGLGIPKDACRAEGDFRKIIEDPGIDMVCIATPDHWHAYMVVEAMKHGKDVFCEKPLTYSVGMCSERSLGYDLKVKLYKSDDHVKNFVECVRERKAAISDHNVGPWTSVLCQLVHMCYLHDTGFDWNPAEMTFANGTGNKDWLSRLEVRPDANRFKVQA